MLKGRRQELHRKIVRMIEECFPNIKTTEPEVLAHHHLTAASRPTLTASTQTAASPATARRSRAPRNSGCGPLVARCHLGLGKPARGQGTAGGVGLK
jgi:predicted ATPase